MTLSIRPAEVRDAAALAEIYAPSVLHRPTSFELRAPDAAEMAARLARVTAMWPWLVAEEGGEVLGYCYAGAFAEREAYRWSVTVSAYVRDGRHRRGIGRQLYAVLFELLRRQGAVSAFAGITLPNEASVGLHRAMGFEPVGLYPQVGFKLGGWHDVAWYGLALRAPSAGVPPEELVPWPALKDRVVRPGMPQG
ncbi:N-acetyltransferase [Rhizobacter sp. AJA081-3]|jgi:phosphinothricin acetyltransferase|uniref:GNAT family N-acetyltransferase n=1 Tax=Rhizobacter sp. AJA081-3 TaxID=2753607 RepID=UPI001AE060C7|nr:GNAT family N-acetyltransferase [Rhizobacter sp. AJA081-3]QTN24317.1 N-acetyltransferase [Rhizobacter sp. AJA081-3]